MQKPLHAQTLHINNVETATVALQIKKTYIQSPELVKTARHRTHVEIYKKTAVSVEVEEAVAVGQTVQNVEGHNLAKSVQTIHHPVRKELVQTGIALEGIVATLPHPLHQRLLPPRETAAYVEVLAERVNPFQEETAGTEYWD